MTLINLRSNVIRSMISVLALASGFAISTDSWAVTDETGRTDSGAWYAIAVPDGWQPGGGLVLINHGFDLQPPIGTPSLGPDVLKQRMLEQGYALAASSFSDRGWALFSTNIDYAELLAQFKVSFGEPGRIIASGGSLGGIVALQQAAQLRGGEVDGVYALCPPAAGSRVWDQAFDLRLIYDAVCDDVTAGSLPGGGDGLPYALDESDIEDWEAWIDGGRAYTAINRCTGIDLPDFLVTSGMERRLDQILRVSGVTREFFIINMAYATFGMSDLLRSEQKLNGRAALDNQFVDYADAQINQDIRRVQADRLAALDLKLNYSPRGNLNGAKVLSTHTSGDGLVVPGHQQILRSLLPPEQLTSAFVNEDEPSHCGYSDAELVAGWEELQLWLDGGPQPTVGSLNATCMGLSSGGDVTGECRYDASVVAEPLEQTLRPRLLPSFPLEGRSTGLWFEPSSSGQGYVIEALADGRAIVAWFSFPAAGVDAEQAWFFGTGDIVDEAIVVEEMQQPVGARFGTAFRPADVEFKPWGRQTFVFTECGVGETGWSAAEPFASGRQELTQLTYLGGSSCASSQALIEGLANFSGAWFAPERNGEGAFVHIQDDGRVFMLWFTYRPQGGQAWIYGEGVIDANGITFNELLRPVGAQFGAAFDPSQVRFERWGQGRIEFGVCDQLSLSYAADELAWGSGTLQWQRLSRPQEVGECSTLAQ